MKVLFLMIVFFVASIVALHKDPTTLVDFRSNYRDDGLIVSAYKRTVGHVKDAITEGIRFTYDGWLWARGAVID